MAEFSRPRDAKLQPVPRGSSLAPNPGVLAALRSPLLGRTPLHIGYQAMAPLSMDAPQPLY